MARNEGRTANVRKASTSKFGCWAPLVVGLVVSPLVRVGVEDQAASGRRQSRPRLPSVVSMGAASALPGAAVEAGTRVSIRSRQSFPPLMRPRFPLPSTPAAAPRQPRQPAALPAFAPCLHSPPAR